MMVYGGYPPRSTAAARATTAAPPTMIGNDTIACLDSMEEKLDQLLGRTSSASASSGGGGGGAGLGIEGTLEGGLPPDGGDDGGVGRSCYGYVAATALGRAVALRIASHHYRKLSVHAAERRAWHEAQAAFGSARTTPALLAAGGAAAATFSEDRDPSCSQDTSIFPSQTKQRSSSLFHLTANRRLGGSAAVIAARGVIPTRRSGSETTSEEEEEYEEYEEYEEGEDARGYAGEGEEDEEDDGESGDEDAESEGMYRYEDVQAEEEVEESYEETVTQSDGEEEDDDDDDEGGDGGDSFAASSEGDEIGLVSVADILARHAAAAKDGLNVHSPTTPLHAKRRARTVPVPRVRAKTKRRAVRTVTRTVTKRVLVRRASEEPQRRAKEARLPPRQRQTRQQRRPTKKKARRRTVDGHDDAAASPIAASPAEAAARRRLLLAAIEEEFRESKHESVYGEAASASRRLSLAAVQSKLDRTRPVPLPMRAGSSNSGVDDTATGGSGFTSVYAGAYGGGGGGAYGGVGGGGRGGGPPLLNVDSCTESIPTSTPLTHDPASLSCRYINTVSTVVHTRENAASAAAVVAGYTDESNHLGVIAVGGGGGGGGGSGGTRGSAHLEALRNASAELERWRRRCAQMEVEREAAEAAESGGGAARLAQDLNRLRDESTVREARWQKRCSGTEEARDHAESKAARVEEDCALLRGEVQMQERRLRDAVEVRDGQIGDLSSRNTTLAQENEALAARLKELAISQKAAQAEESKRRRREEAAAAAAAARSGSPASRGVSSNTSSLLDYSADREQSGAASRSFSPLRRRPPSVPPAAVPSAAARSNPRNSEEQQALEERRSRSATAAAAAAASAELGLAAGSPGGPAASPSPSPPPHARRVVFGGVVRGVSPLRANLRERETTVAAAGADDTAPPPVWTPRSGSAAGSTARRRAVEIVVRKRADEVLGAKFRGEACLILEDVEAGTSSFEHGLETFLGQRLTHIGSTAVYSCNDVRNLAIGAVRVTLRFDPVVHKVRNHRGYEG